MIGLSPHGQRVLAQLCRQPRHEYAPSCCRPDGTRIDNEEDLDVHAAQCFGEFTCAGQRMALPWREETLDPDLAAIPMASVPDVEDEQE